MKPSHIGLLVLAVTLFAFVLLWFDAGALGMYGAVLVGLFALKTFFSWRANDRSPLTRAESAALDTMNVGTAIPVFNEDPALLLRCLESLLEQTRLPQSVVVIDDCSGTPDALAAATSLRSRFQEAGVALITYRFDTNRGKREGLIAALDLQPDADTLLCVDSDTVLQPDALERLLPAFLDEDIHAATGLVLPLNHSKNLLTRLTDVRYANAFLFERAAYSSMKSVLCCCGSLAIYRSALMRQYREDFLGQTFMGQPAVFGDDRRLTNYALLEGGAVLQAQAVAFTAVPERLGHYVRQQIRWSKSFFRESLWAVRELPARRPAMWLSAVELGSWVLFTLALIGALLVVPFVVGQVLIVPILMYSALLAYARSARYFEVTGIRRSKKETIVGFAIAPLYGIFHLTVLMWLRVYAIATIRQGAWGTRRDVEVTVGEVDSTAERPGKFRVAA